MCVQGMNQSSYIYWNKAKYYGNEAKYYRYEAVYVSSINHSSVLALFLDETASSNDGMVRRNRYKLSSRPIQAMA